MMHHNDSEPITLNISGPQKKGGHRMYSIVGQDKNSEFNTVKRYTDFQQLRKTLFSRWPGCYIPSLAEKKVIGNQDPVYLQIRKKAVISFMDTLKNLPTLWYAQETQLFLNKIGDTEKDLQKMKDITMHQILEKYKTLFPNYLNKQVTKEVNDKIVQFGQDLKKMRGLLTNLDRIVEQVFNSHKKYNEKFSTMIQTLLPDYERNCLQVYKNESEMQQMIFTGSRKQKIVSFYEKFSKKSNSIMRIFAEVKREKQEIQSFEDLLKVREQYAAQKHKMTAKIRDLEIETTKIHGGKESLMSKIKNKTKEQQLKDNESMIQKAKQEQKKLELFCQILSFLLVEQEIKKFKSQRQSAYYKLLKEFFSIEKQECALKRQFWSLIEKERSLEKQELDNFFQTDKSPSKQSLDESPNKKENFSPNEKEQIESEKLDQDKDKVSIDSNNKSEDHNKVSNEVQIEQKMEQISNEQQKETQEESKQIGQQ